MKLLSVGIACVVLSANVLAAEGRWTQDSGQGSREYFIDANGVRLVINCPTKKDSAAAISSVELQRISDGLKARQFSVTAGSLTVDGPFSTDSRMGKNSFIALINALRKDDAVVKVGWASFAIPKSNAAKILPQYGKKGFACNIG